MNKISKIILPVLVLVALFAACKKNDISPENIFTKIYSDPNSDISYYPLDIAEASSGYYILAGTAADTARTWLNTYISRVDAEGEMVWSAQIEAPYVNPIANLIELNGAFYIFCMDEISLSTHILQVDDGGQTASHVATLNEAIYPLAVSKTPDNNILLLSYDRDSRSSRLSKIDASFTIQWQKDFRVNEDAEGLLVDHLIKTGRNIPFFTGTVGSGGQYFVNALYNYTLSLIFVDASNGDRTGVVQGYRYDGGAGCLLSLSGNDFALGRYVFSEHFIMPTVSLDMNSITNMDDLGGAYLAEIAPEAETKVKQMTVAGKDAIVFATNTNSNQVVIYAYDMATNELILKKYLGFANPVTVGAFLQTSDGGIGILVQTKVTGRFKRIGFYKIPKEHIE
jgi:hypothetical protein